MSNTSNMKVLEKKSASVALLEFIEERTEYEHKHKLSHDSRSYEVRRKFKAAGILPKYTDDKELGDFQVMPSSDLDVISDKSIFKINSILKDIDPKTEKMKRVRKVSYTDIKLCGCFDCQKKTDKNQLTVNPAE